MKGQSLNYDILSESWFEVFWRYLFISEYPLVQDWFAIFLLLQKLILQQLFGRQPSLVPDHFHEELSELHTDI